MTQYFLRTIYSRQTLYRHLLAHSWTFLSASGQGAKPVQEIHIERVVSGYSTAAILGAGRTVVNHECPGNIPRRSALVDNCILSVTNYVSPRVGLRALYWPTVRSMSTFHYLQSSKMIYTVNLSNLHAHMPLLFIPPNRRLIPTPDIQSNLCPRQNRECRVPCLRISRAIRT